MDIGYDLMTNILNLIALGFGTVLWWMIKDIKQSIKEIKTDMNHVENMARESEIKVKQLEKFSDAIDSKLSNISNDITELKVMIGKVIPR